MGRWKNIIINGLDEKYFLEFIQMIKDIHRRLERWPEIPQRRRNFID